MLVVDDSRPYLSHDDWLPAALGRRAPVVGARRFGALVERRVRLASGLEVELGIVTTRWAAADPVESGTARVVGDGARILFDRRATLTALVAAVQGIDRTAPTSGAPTEAIATEGAPHGHEQAGGGDAPTPGARDP